MDDKPKSQIYRVTLKTGEYADFPNRNNFDNYENRLVSGMYGIATKDGHTPITVENVQSIEIIGEEA